MTTIEERAEKAYPIKKADFEEYAGYNTYADLYGDQQEAYIKGATKQREIDLTLAAKWIKNNWMRYLKRDADGMFSFSGWEKDLSEYLKGESKSTIVDDYLLSKIEQATPKLKDVDVDEFMHELRDLE